MQKSDLHPCIGCGALLPHLDGPVHDYMESSPACWDSYGRVLALEYSTPGLYSVHRLTVDSYAVQHPGGASRQAIQSVGLHLVRLCLFLERELTAEEANDAMLAAGKTKGNMIHLSRPESLGEVTVVDVLTAKDHLAHKDAVRKWARSAWQAWSEHHPTVREWADASRKP